MGPFTGMAKPPPSAYLRGMRYCAYLLTLTVIWVASMTGLVWGLNGFLFGGAGPGLSGWLIFSGAQIAAFASVSLAEEVADLRQGRAPQPGGCNQRGAAGHAARLPPPASPGSTAA